MANKLAREQRVREDFIAYEQLQVLRRRLNICYREEGVNHYENCRDIAEEYYKTLHAPNRGALYSVKKE